MTAIVILLALSSTAQAEACPELYTADKVQADLQSATEALKSGDSKGLKSITTQIEKNIICMNTPAPPQVFATLYRLIGVGYYKSKDQVNAHKWLKLAIEIDYGYQWSFEEVSQDDPLRPYYSDLRNNADLKKQPIADMAINIESGTKLWIDGRNLTEPSATMDRPHVLFLADTTDRTIVERHLIDGNAIPEKYLGEIQLNRSRGDENDMFAVTKVQRIRPKGKTPLLIAGGVSLAASVGMYGATFATNAQFQDAVNASKPSTQLESIRTKNNTLVISSLLLGGVGAGLTFTGVMLDGSPGLSFGWQY